ncbi:DUF3416 domain-containing protein [Streptomyces tricolor]|nr:DUF3416 domain-containing protein [Streptomyces tricolor]
MLEADRSGHARHAPFVSTSDKQQDHGGRKKTTGRKGAAPAGAAGPSAAGRRSSPDAVTTLGRIPVLDVRPVVQHGRRPPKAVTGESFEVSATVFREGHDAVAANVVLRDPAGRAGPWTPMRNSPRAPTAGAPPSPRANRAAGPHTVEAWSDPLATWRQHARIKIPAGIDTELVLAEGALLYERAAAGVPKAHRRPVLDAVAALRDESRPAAWRLAAALAPDVRAPLDRYPLRELVTASDPMPLLVERERALYGSWYEFFPPLRGHPPSSRTARSARPPAGWGRSRRWASTSSTCRPSTPSARPSARAATTASPPARTTSACPGRSVPRGRPRRRAPRPRHHRGLRLLRR